MSQHKYILFISYFFEPYGGVGAQRLSYWAKNLAKLDKHVICDVITVTEQKDNRNVYKYIRSIHVSNNISKPSMLSFFIKDQGLGWGKSIKIKLKELAKTNKYDVVIMSGGPFMQFALVPYIKKLFKSKVILDFRDPFAVNPRFNNSLAKVAIKKIFEKQFVKNADHIITVNDYCLPLLAGYNKYKSKFSVIDNGFEETVINKTGRAKLIDNAKVKFIYAGTFYEDRNPTSFLQVVTDKTCSGLISFHHVGQASGFLKKFEDKANVFQYGIMPHGKTLDMINSMDVGLIFTGGYKFESTLKIFDYIGLEKIVLIITKGEIRTGRLEQITKQYPGIFWSVDEQQAIKQALNSIAKSNINISFPEKFKYSKKEGLKKLIKILDNI